MSKFQISGTVEIPKAKAATYGFKAFETTDANEFIDYLNTHATIAVSVKGGHREYASVTTIYNWFRVDIDDDMEELMKVRKILEPYYYIDVPSTSWNKVDKSYKRHIFVKTKNISQKIEGYKKQMSEVVERLYLGFIKDDKTIINCVQNFNPYGRNKNSIVNEGKSLKLIKVIDSDYPKNKVYKSTTVNTKNGVILEGEISAPIIVEETDKVTLVGGDSVVATEGGFLTLKEIEEVILESKDKNPTWSQLGCVYHNEDHGGGGGQHTLGYGHASLEGGRVYFHCGGSSCKGRLPIAVAKNTFSKKEGVSVASKEYVAPVVDKKLVNTFHYESWMGDAPINKIAVKAYLQNTGYDVSSGKFRWVSSSGIIRDFAKMDAANFFKTYNIKADESEESLQVIDEWLAKNSVLKQPKEKEYWKFIHKRMLDWVMFHHQYKTMRVKVNPFGENGVEFEGSTMIVITKNVIPKAPKKVIDNIIIDDYKEHFKELDDVLDVMLAARFGADRKKAYLWMKCISDWGKSFFFVGVLGSLGITTMLKEKELKKAMGGDPSGLMGDDFYTSWITIFEEFKGAVSELKDITHSLILAPKGQARVEVDLYAKVFLSAENVNSLVGDSGAEKQFANRFMMMDLDGVLTERDLYNKNNNYYRDVIRWYVYDYILKGVKHYLSLGENKSSIKANEVLNKFRGSHILKAEDIMSSVAEVREQYYSEIKMKLSTFSGDREEINDLYILKEGELFIKKLGLAKEHFLKTMFAKNDISKLNHKSSREVLNLMDTKRKSLRIKEVLYNAYRI